MRVVQLGFRARSVAQGVLGDRASGRLEREVRRLDRGDGVKRRDLAPRLGELAGDADAQAIGEAVLVAPQLVDGILHGASAERQWRAGREATHWCEMGSDGS